MPSESGYPARAPIYAVLGPLGWTLKMMADAAECSKATVQNDLRARGGLTGAFPNRPTGGGAYAATFLCYAKREFPHLHELRQIVEDFLEVHRIMHVAEGMERALMALQAYPTLPEDKGYLKLISAVFGRRSRDIIWTPVDVHERWEQYLEDVRSERIPPPKSAEKAIATLAERLHAAPERLEIMMPMPDGLLEAMHRALATLTERDRTILVRRFGLEPGTEPIILEDLAKEMRLSRERIRHIEMGALRQLQHPACGLPYLAPYEPRDLREIRESQARLREEIATLKKRAEASEDKYEKLLTAVREDSVDEFLDTWGMDDLFHLLSKRVDELELSVRSQNCLESAGIEYIWQFVEKDERAHRASKCFGRKSINELKEVLGYLDPRLQLGMTFPTHIREKLLNTRYI